MKRIVSTLGLTAALAAAPVLAGAKELSFNGITGPTHTDNTYVMPRYSDAIEEGTEGRYSIKVFTGSVLAGPAVAFESIGKGIIDMGGIFYAYTPALAPALTLIGDIPGNNAVAASAAATETIMLECPECQEQLDDLGVTIIADNSTLPFRLFCATKPVSTMDDIKGLKVRSSGYVTQFAAALGMTPVNITFTEIYEAMQRGQVDCAAIGTESVGSLNMWDTVDFITMELPLGTAHGWTLLALNKGIWDEMTDADRRVWLDNAAQVIVDNNRKGVENAAKVFTDPANKAEQVTATPELQAALKEVQDQQIEVAIASARDRGVTDPEAIAAAFQKNYDKWLGIYEEIGGDGDWTDAQWDELEARLQSEIYDKVPSDY